MSKRILLIAATTGYQTRAFAEAAARAGFEIVLATDRCHILEDPWGDHAIPVRFEDPLGAAGLIASTVRVDGIVALGDRPAHVAAIVAARLGIPYNSPDATAACRNKFLAHQRFQAAGLPTPRFYQIALQDDPSPHALGADYPCVLKPLSLSASRGVIRANNALEFIAAFERIRALLAAPEEFLQVESFIPGREFALEGLVEHGALRVLALFDKPDPLDGPFFEETIYVTPSRANVAVQAAIVETAQRAVHALGVEHGPVHAEMRVNDKGVWMLEVAARPIGGLCARVLPGLEELILRHAAGEPVGALDATTGSGVMMISIPAAGVYAGVEGVEEACATPGIVDITITAKNGQKLMPLPEGNSYLGFIFSKAAAPAEAEDALRLAHAKLRFTILAALPVV